MASLRTVCSMGLRALPRTQPAVRTVLKQVNWKAAQQQSLRQFSSCMVHRSRPPRSPRVLYQYHAQTDQSEYNQYPPPPREPFGSGSSTLILGSVVGVCVGLFGYTALQGTEYRANGSKKAAQWLQTINNHFTLSIRNVREGRYYVLLTSTLAHTNLTHLAFNMIALWGFGRTIVSWYGLPTFAIIWVGSAAVGGIVQMGYWMKYGHPGMEMKAVGCSGAVFGMLSALSFVAPEMRVLLLVIPMSLRMSMAISVVFSLAAIREGWLPWLGHVDHMGGMAFGAFWWLVALRRGRIGRLY